MYIANRDGSVSCVKIGYGTVDGSERRSISHFALNL